MPVPLCSALVTIKAVSRCSQMNRESHCLRTSSEPISLSHGWHPVFLQPSTRVLTPCKHFLTNPSKMDSTPIPLPCFSFHILSAAFLCLFLWPPLVLGPHKYELFGGRVLVRRFLHRSSSSPPSSPPHRRAPMPDTVTVPRAPRGTLLQWWNWRVSCRNSPQHASETRKQGNNDSVRARPHPLLPPSLTPARMEQLPKLWPCW